MKLTPDGKKLRMPEFGGPRVVVRALIGRSSAPVRGEVTVRIANAA